MGAPTVTSKIRWIDVIHEEKRKKHSLLLFAFAFSVMTTHLVPNRCFILK